MKFADLFSTRQANPTEVRAYPNIAARTSPADMPTPRTRPRKTTSWRGSYACLMGLVLLATATATLAQGADALYIDANGKVGIGVTQPGANLDISGAANTEDQISLQLRSGNNSGNSESNQITFGWSNGNKYRHAIKTRHNADGTENNAIDFYVWNKGQGAGEIGKLPTLTLNGGKVGIGTTEPKYQLDLAGNLLVNSKANPILFTSKWSNFPAQDSNKAEISNDIDTYKKLMIVGNRSAGGNRKVGIWDDLTVDGDLYVKGKLVYYWNVTDGTAGWYKITNRGGGWAGSVKTDAPSDKRLKTDVHALPDALQKVRLLRGIGFRWNEQALQLFTNDIEATVSAGPAATEAENQALWRALREQRYQELEMPQVGVVAQDVEAVLPEAVTTDEDGYKSVRYQDLIPLLIEAVKEQDKTVKEQNKMLQEQADLLAKQQAEIARLMVAEKQSREKLSELGDVKTQLEQLAKAVRVITAAQHSPAITAMIPVH